MYALSTSWNAARHSQGKDIINEIKGLGFDCIELNFTLSAEKVDEIAALREQGLIKIISLHNFCPIPEGISGQDASPDIFSLSALDEPERQKAVFYTKKTIDTAVRVGAKVVVLHVGKVEMPGNTKALFLLYQQRQRAKYYKLKAEMLKTRRAKSKKFLSQTLSSLEQLCRYAQKRKVKLGIENRYYFNEIPSREEMAIILENFPGPPLYYWHDVGHAQVYENMHFFAHRTLLDKFSQRMIGIHLHDIKGMDDHRAPLKGEFDFSLLKPYISKETLKVLEPHYPAKAEDIIRGRNYLEKLFGF